MARIHLVEHATGAPGLRLMGLGPNLRPTRGLLKLRRLLNKYAFWAQGRSRQQLREMLDNDVTISLGSDSKWFWKLVRASVVRSVKQRSLSDAS